MLKVPIVDSDWSIPCRNDIFTPLFEVFRNQTNAQQASNGRTDAGALSQFPSALILLQHVLPLSPSASLEKGCRLAARTAADATKLC